MAENAIAIRPGFKDMTPTFDPVTQLDAVASVAHSPLALCVAEQCPGSNVEELIALSRSSREEVELRVGRHGLGRAACLGGRQATARRSTRSTVPYRGGGPAMAAIIAGQVDDHRRRPSRSGEAFGGGQARSRPCGHRARNARRLCGMCRHWRRSASSHADVDLQFWFGVFGPKGTAGRREGEAGEGASKRALAVARRSRASRPLSTSRRISGPDRRWTRSSRARSRTGARSSRPRYQGA